MIYFAKITKQKTGEMLVEFPELDGCFTEGSDINEALENAKEALELTLKQEETKKAEMEANKKQIELQLQQENTNRAR